MTDIEAHPTTDRLSAYVQGQLDEPAMDEIEEHLSGCDSCCQWIRDQPEDALVAKLRGRGAATIAGVESAVEPPSGLQVPSSFVLGTDARTTHQHDPPAIASLPRELNDHPRYRIVAALGAGGMGAVYRAEHRLMDRPVALKVIRADLLGNPALVERFRREVKSAARLVSHPNIVAAYDAEQAGETHMLVMEFIEGTDLARLVDRRGPLPVGEACEYVHQAALGLQHAFEDGMVHRDIKPQNLMRTSRGQVKILDFGLARFASEVGSDAGMTAEGMVLGSADYIAPEQIEDPHAADIRADLYSLGCTLYFLLAGHPPFPHRSLIQKLIAHREKTARAIGEIRADVPPELARVVERMMARDPSRRFQTPDEVARALAPFAESQTAAPGLDEPALTGSRALPPNLTPFDSMVGQLKRAKQATRSGAHPWRPWVWILAALALLPVAVVALALILYQLTSIRTPTGELIIETDDPNVEVIVKQGGRQVTIFDPKTRDRIELNAGLYELQLARDDRDLKLSTETLTLRRGDKVVVTVRRQLLPPDPRPGPQPLDEHPKIVITSPKATDVIVTQPYVCRIESRRHIDVRSPEDGYLQEISVKEGQAVKQGDLMFKVVPIVLYQARLDAERDGEKIAEPELKSTNVRAPFDGIVGRLHEQFGTLIKDGVTLTTLSDNSVMRVYFNVPEKQYLEYMANRKQHEAEDRIELVLANGNKFPQPGKIGAIAAQFTPQTGNIPFQADFPNPDGLLRDGQTGTILIHRPLHNAFVIPQRATYELLDKRYVYVVDQDGVVHQRLIVVQHETDDIFVIKEGVGVGDRIVVEGVRQVRDGEKVEYEFRRPEEVMGKPISPRTQAILDALEEPLPMDFANETSLDDFLTYIKQATFKGKKPTDPGLPIYVDPLVERMLTSRVQMNMNGLPLRVALSHLLGRVGLAYLVKDGVLIISTPQYIDRERRETASPAADAMPGTKRVMAKLEEPLTMAFANRTSLDDVLTYIRLSTTSSRGHDGIPIGTDLDGLKEAGCSITSTVSIDLDGVPLKMTLRLLLKQLGLAYVVKDGSVIISSIEGIQRSWKPRPDAGRPTLVEPPKTQGQAKEETRKPF